MVEPSLRTDGNVLSPTEYGTKIIYSDTAIFSKYTNKNYSASKTQKHLRKWTHGTPSLGLIEDLRQLSLHTLVLHLLFKHPDLNITRFQQELMLRGPKNNMFFQHLRKGIQTLANFRALFRFGYSCGSTLGAHLQRRAAVRVSSNSGCLEVLPAMMVAMAMPQLPLPTT